MERFRSTLRYHLESDSKGKSSERIQPPPKTKPEILPVFFRGSMAMICLGAGESN